MVQLFSAGVKSGWLQCNMFITVCKPIFYTFVPLVHLPLFLRLSSDDGTCHGEELGKAYGVSSESESTHI
jgi:hypothetical protein